MTNFESMFWCPEAAIKTIRHLMAVQASCDRHYDRTGELHDCGTCWAWWYCGGESERADRWLKSDLTREECDEARRCE